MTLELDEAQHKMLMSVVMTDHEALSAELLAGAINALRRRQLERRQRELRRMIADAERKQDAAAIAQLIQEKQEVDRALRHAVTV